MKKYLSIIAVIAIAFSTLFSCQKGFDSLLEGNPFEGSTKKLHIYLVYPEGWDHEKKAGVEVTITNPQKGLTYTIESDAEGKAVIDLEYGFYRVSVSDVGQPVSGAIPLFNRSIDQVRITDADTRDVHVEVPLITSYTGQLIIKEIYYRGCKASDGKNYQFDKYMIIYNNSEQVAYLDSVCFGTVEPYNAPSRVTAWTYLLEGQTVIMDTIPIVEAIWQFPGTGTSHPLQPGEQAVVGISGGIDHTILHPNSVNLNKPDYWICYNPRYTNQNYHPSPGDNLANKWLDLLWKEGGVTAFPFSVASPAPVIFRIPDISAQAFINNPENRSRKPGAAGATTYVMIPSEWILDGVECFDTAAKFKRLPASVDAGYMLMGAGDAYQGKVIQRKVDIGASGAAGGRIVYQDTNNSTNDFVIKETQSIKEN